MSESIRSEADRDELAGLLADSIITTWEDALEVADGVLASDFMARIRREGAALKLEELAELFLSAPDIEDEPDFTPHQIAVSKVLQLHAAALRADRKVGQ